MSDIRLLELSQDLSPDERKKLLDKIHKNLNPEMKDNSSQPGISLPADEVQSRLKKEVESLGFWAMIWMKFLMFFSGRRAEELQMENKLKKMVQNIEIHTSGLLSHGGKDLSSLFAQGLYDLFSSAYYLQNLWDGILKTEGFLHSHVGELVEARIPNPKVGVFDLLSMEEMADIYRKTGQKSAIVKRIRETIPLYLESLHPSVFKETADDLLPLYFIKTLINFPYRLFLQVFGHDPGVIPPEKYPNLHNANLKRCTEYIDRLYLALYLTCKIKNIPKGFDKLLDKAVSPEFAKQFSINEDGKVTREKVETLLKDAQRLFTEFPLKELIQLSRRDPYFSIKISIPNLNIKEIYHSLLLLRFGQQTEDFFPDLRGSILKKEKDSLFQNQNSQLLEYYKLDINPLINTYKLPQFSHVESLNLVYTFLTTYFTVHYQPLIRTLAQVVLQSFKALMSSLLQMAADLEEIKTGILNFDGTLSPTNEDGKIFLHLKTELEKKTTSHQLYSALVERKNRESQKIIDDAIKSFMKLEEQLTTINNHTSAQMKTLLRMPYIMGGARSKISESVIEKISMLKKILRLIKEINTTENNHED